MGEKITIKFIKSIEDPDSYFPDPKYRKVWEIKRKKGIHLKDILTKRDFEEYDVYVNPASNINKKLSETQLPLNVDNNMVLNEDVEIYLDSKVMLKKLARVLIADNIKVKSIKLKCNF